MKTHHWLQITPILLLLGGFGQARATATLDPNTLQLDTPYLLYQSEQGDVPVWARLQFVPNNEGQLLWQVTEVGAVTTPRRAERAGDRPFGTISSDLQLLQLPDVSVGGVPFAGTWTNVPSQDGTKLYALRSYQRWTDTTYSAQGSDITDPNTGIRIKSADGKPFDVTLSVIQDEDNNWAVNFYFRDFIVAGTATRQVDIYLSAPSGTVADDRGDAIKYLWSQTGLKYFMRSHDSLVEKNRLPESKQQQFRAELKYGLIGATWITGFTLHAKLPSKLYGYCADSDSACYQGKPPVLFVHGYQRLGGFGGGDGTWGNFPKLLADKYAPFEFVWRTNARFEDVANDLGNAVKLIQQKTGKPVYIIAHSFGGLLSRTWLQGLASDSATPSASGLVAGLTTLGTPHSGIADQNSCLAGIALPGGQDGIDWFEGCQQASCELAGEAIFSDAMRNLFGSGLGKPMRPGELIQKLNDFNAYPLPSIDILVQIGLTSGRGLVPTHPVNKVYLDTGDGVITHEGQRFAPSDTVQGSCFENQGSVTARDSSLRLSPVNVGGARVKEVFLGFPDTWRPGEFNLYANDGFYGYKHAKNFVSGSPRMEAYVDCPSADNCDHHAFQYTLAWLNSLSGRLERLFSVLPNYKYVEDVFPGEGGLLGKWTLRESHKFYSSPFDYKDNPYAVGSLLTLQPGTIVTADKFRTFTHSYGACEVTKPRTATITQYNDYPLDWNEISLSLKQGDIIITMMYYGEGVCKLLLNGKILSPVDCPCPLDSDGCTESASLVCDNTLQEYQVDWWARSQLTTGTVGWLHEPNAQGMSVFE